MVHAGAGVASCWRWLCCGCAAMCAVCARGAKAPPAGMAGCVLMLGLFLTGLCAWWRWRYLFAVSIKLDPPR